MITAMSEEVGGWFGPGEEYALILDHATPHKSHASTTALSDLGVPVKQDFPARSWDLNIIENVWGVLDDYMLQRSATSNEGWMREIESAWDSIDISTVNKLVDSVHRRMREIEGKGGQWLPNTWDQEGQRE